MQSLLTPSGYLLSLRQINGEFTAERIRKCVFDYVGQPANKRSVHDYLDVLRSAGYSFQAGGSNHDVIFREPELLLFQPEVRHRLFPCTEIEGYSQAFLDKLTRRIHDYLEQIGFLRMFHAVILTNDPLKVIELELDFEDGDSLSILPWYYGVDGFRRLPDHPAGCLYFHGKSRFPILFVSPPAFSRNTAAIQEIRFIRLMRTLPRGAQGF